MPSSQADALVEYEDPYCQPLLESAMSSQLPEDRVRLISSLSEHASPENPLLQFVPYESIDFEQGLSDPRSCFNAYVIRKALIRKHYLSSTILSWVTKHPDSSLVSNFKPAVDFELDYAEFLEDALLEAYELTNSLKANLEKPCEERDWWILKPGMSDRGQGIRLFSTEEDLQGIFEAWEAEYPDSEGDSSSQSSTRGTGLAQKVGKDEGIVVSQLRHFVAQPYIHPPLLIEQAPYSNRKFHIRTYVIASGALSVYVYQPMLALFASAPYEAPWVTEDIEVNKDQPSLLQRFQNIHLTNTCVQTSSVRETNQEANPAHLLSFLPLAAATQKEIFEQINSTTAEVFRAAVAQPTNFQPLPQAFEIFGFDFLVSQEPAETHDIRVWLLEINAFPDFAQTGEFLKDEVVKGLFEDLMSVVVGPKLGILDVGNSSGTHRLVKVLEEDLGRGNFT